MAQPMAEDVREIYRVRRYVEPAALRWSTTSNFSALREAVENAQLARAAGSATDMGTANQNFHATVVSLAGSPRLSAMMAPVLAEMRLVFHAMAFDPEFHAPYIAENAHVVDLLERGKRSDAAELMRTYLDSAEQELLAVMQQA
ncbi:GntR family transcriptional regulator [Arthrobacter sp. NPDC057013]|uniref:GntR family transcriptional regulator n=1 Tax=Arthrobacter sp. NPDC057013 TaxID=3345999 RepID=UPI003626DFB2